MDAVAVTVHNTTNKAPRDELKSHHPSQNLNDNYTHNVNNIFEWQITCIFSEQVYENVDTTKDMIDMLPSTTNALTKVKMTDSIIRKTVLSQYKAVANKINFNKAQGTTDVTPDFAKNFKVEEEADSHPT